MTGLVPISSAPIALGSGGGIGALSRKAKAAIIVRILLNEGADIPLEDLPESCQEELTKAMGSMRTIDKDTVASVVEEFTEEVEKIGLSFPEGMAGALTALDGKINPLTAERLRKEAGVRMTGDPWERISDQSIETLLPVLGRESVEVAAVMLSKLPTKKAAELMGKLPPARARRIAYAVSLTGQIAPDAVDRIGLSLAAQMSARPITAFDEDPVQRVGAILNSTTSITRDDVLEGLDEQDQGFANEVRKAIFTFANIPTRVAPRDIPRILREIDQADLVTAMAGAEITGMQVTADYILENMSGRMADQLREEIEEAEKPKAADIEEAMGRIVDAIRGLEQSGELLLITEDDEDD